MEICRHRSALQHARDALARGQLTLGFLGGSITDSRPGWNWPGPVVAWFQQAYPTVRIQVENAAIGATGSALAVFRADEAILAPGCDLVFVEYAVNDGSLDAALRRRTEEGLLRKLLADGQRDVVLVYTYDQSMYTDMLAGELPPTIAGLELLAEHYRLGSVWMGLHALRELQAGRLRWEEWLPDGLHPQYRGSLAYAEAVNSFLEAALHGEASSAAALSGPDLPAPRDPAHWQAATTLPLTDARWEGPWALRRWYNLPFVSYVLDTAAVGARLEFEFEGRALALAFDFGATSAEFRYALDDGPWQDVVRERPAWCGPSGWLRLELIADDLPFGQHHFAMVVTHGNRADCTGTNMRLALIGVVP